jgi:hypothetical protein
MSTSDSPGIILHGSPLKSSNKLQSRSTLFVANCFGILYNYYVVYVINMLHIKYTFQVSFKEINGNECNDLVSVLNQFKQ